MIRFNVDIMGKFDLIFCGKNSVHEQGITVFLFNSGYLKTENHIKVL